MPNKTKPLAKISAQKSTPGKKAPPLSISTYHGVVENLRPRVDDGAYPVKAVPGEAISVTADLFRDGHEKCEADLLFRRQGAKTWQRAPMRFVDNDLWAGTFTVDALGFWEFTLEVRTASRPGSAT